MQKAPRNLVLPATFVLALVLIAVLAFVYIEVNYPRSAGFLTRITQQQLQDGRVNGVPETEISTVLDGLNQPWDIGFLYNNDFLFTQKGNKVSYFDGEKVTDLNAPNDTLVRGEGGMLGIAVDPFFVQNRYVYLCFNASVDNGVAIKVARFRFDQNSLRLEDREDIVIDIPANPSGRHSGCQPEFGPDGYLWIGTGDTANSGISQNPDSLGGKVLRIDRNGNAAPGNLDGEFDPRIFSYGHRNIQGLAFFPNNKSDATGVSVEHGPSTDDELNALVSGNFGWDPGSNYFEQVPMTDLQRFPDAVESIWSSGESTLATSGVEIIEGEQWGDWDGAIIMAALRTQRLVLLQLTDDLQVAERTDLFTGEFGRIRTVKQGKDGNLYMLTDNRFNKDKIVRIVPK